MKIYLEIMVIMNFFLCLIKGISDDLFCSKQPVITNKMYEISNSKTKPNEKFLNLNYKIFRISSPSNVLKFLSNSFDLFS